MNPKIITSLLLLTLSSMFFAGCGGNVDVDSLVQSAETQVEDGKLAEAEILLRNALREDPKNARALALIGKVYKLQGRLRDSYQALTAVKQLNPSDASSLEDLAGIELVAGLRDKALENARKALELDPSLEQAPILLAELADTRESADQTKEWLESLTPTASIHAAIGSLDLRTGKIAEASQNFERAIELDPNSAIGHAGRFQILGSQNKREEAMEAFAMAAEVAGARSGIRIRYIQYLQQSQGDEAAKAALDETLAEASDYLPAISLAAELAAKMQQTEESKKLVERALRLDPIDPTALRIKGTLLVLDEKIDEAIVQLERVLEIYPEDVKTNYQVALAYLAKRDLLKAKARLTKVVYGSPAHLEASALLSTIQVQEEDYAGAIITLERFLKANPNSLQGYLLLAEVYNRKGDNAAAVAIYNQLESNQPENPQLDYLSGVSYLQGQNPEGARSAFESALSNDPLHLQSVEQLTILDIGENKFDTALDRINRTIEATPNTSILYTIRAQIHQSLGDAPAAIESFEKSIELDPDNRTARTLYARLLRSQGDIEGALAQSQSILESNPNDIGAMTSIASIYEAEEKLEEAAELYEKMLTIDSSYIPALNNLAYLYSTKFDKPERAFELAQEARELAPNNPYLSDTLGWIVFKRGDYTWALSLLSESYSKLNGNPEVAYHFGSAHYFAGNEAKAAELLEVAAKSEQAFTGKEDAQLKSNILSTDVSSPSSSQIDLLADASGTGDPTAWVMRARISEAESEVAEAIGYYQKALDNSPTHFAALTGKALALGISGAISEASKLAEQAVDIQPNNPTAIYVQGEIAFLAGDYLGAVGRLAEAVRLDPQNSSAQKSLAFSNFAIGELERSRTAAATYQSQTDNEDLAPWLQTLQALLNPGIELGQQVSIPEDLKDLYEGTQALREDDLEEAKARFVSVLDTYPNQRQAKLGLGEILAEDPSNTAEIERIAGEVRKIDRNNSAARALQAIATFQKGQAEQAQQILETLSSAETQALSPRIQAKIEMIKSSEDDTNG